MPAWETELYEAAKKEKEFTVYTAHCNTEEAANRCSAFEKKYPGVKCNFVRATAQVAFQRFQQDLQANKPVAPLLSSTDVGHYVDLKKRGMLMTCNASLVPEKDAPKNWQDLLDPKRKGKVSIGHPAFRGCVGTWVVLMRKLYGWDYFEKLAKNQPQIGRSVNDTVTMLNAKERWVAAGPEATMLPSRDKGIPEVKGKFRDTFGIRAGDRSKAGHSRPGHAVRARRALAAPGQVVLGVSAASLCVVFGVPMAWALSRTDMPAKGLIWVSILGTFVIPPHLRAVGWILLAGPNAGWLNRFVVELTGAQSGPFDIFSMPGLVRLFDKSDEGNLEMLASIGLVLVLITFALILVGFRLMGRDFMLRRPAA